MAISGLPFGRSYQESGLLLELPRFLEVFIGITGTTLWKKSGFRAYHRLSQEKRRAPKTIFCSIFYRSRNGFRNFQYYTLKAASSTIAWRRVLRFTRCLRAYILST